MRSYIFTELERALIREFLEGRISIGDRDFHATVSRVRHFKELSKDVDLYLELRRRIAESDAARAT